MAKKIPALIQLSTAELKRLLAARERIDVLEQEKARLLKSLSAVDSELGRLLAGLEPAAGRAARGTRRKAVKKAAGKTAKKTAKKTARKTAGKAAGRAAGKTARKAAKRTAKKTAKKAAGKTAKKTVGRKAGRKPVRRTAARAARGAGRVRLEDVIVAVLRQAGRPLPFKDLYAAIVDGKLFSTRSSNFDNVLRRTLSTSGAVKRVGRGIYAVA